MAAANQPKPSIPNQHTINVTELRTETREILENAHFRGWHYVVQRAGQPMIAVLDYEEYERLLAITAGEGAGDTRFRKRGSGQSG
jgi:prevent-host-death family protein